MHKGAQGASSGPHIRRRVDNRCRLSTHRRHVILITGGLQPSDGGALPEVAGQRQPPTGRLSDRQEEK